jgi:hypothetical protein
MGSIGVEPRYLSLIILATLFYSLRFEGSDVRKAAFGVEFCFVRFSFGWGGLFFVLYQPSKE